MTHRDTVVEYTIPILRNQGDLFMRIKTSRVMAVLLLGTLFLTGCSSNANNSASKKTTTTAVSHKKSSAKKTSAVKESKGLWNSDKDAKLKDFIDQWAPTMNQSYVKYDGKHALKTSAGTAYPTDLKHVTVNSSNASIGWNKTGNGKYEYNVVAIYNYNETASSAKHITYFFAFHNGQPVALVDQSTNGTPDLLPTQNAEVASGFENIVNGQTAEVSDETATSNSNTSDGDKDNSSKSSSTQSISDPKIVGIMLYEMRGNFEITGDTYLQLESSNNSSDGRYYVSTKVQSSNLPFTVEGNTAHYWTRLYNGVDTRPDGTIGTSPETEHTISIEDLAAKYYSTNDQKKTIDQLAAQMPIY